MISLCRIAGFSTCLTVLVSLSAFAQCTGVYQTITYDTLVSGSGNDAHTFSMPQFDPSLGTLVSVNINSIVSVNYGFTLTNINSSPIDFTVGLGRKDNVQSSVLSSPYNNTIDTAVGTFYLNPSQTVTQAPTTIINRYNNSVMLTSDVVSFMGNGAIGFNYSPRTYAHNSGSPTYNYSATASDTIHFFITYSYCNQVVLLPDLVNFSAVKENNTSVKLLWTTINEQPDRIYEVQKSTDGLNFFAAGTISSKIDPDNSGNYLYHYEANATEKSRLWFRLKITDASGNVKYSNIKLVDMGTNSSVGIYLYPNPSDQFVNIVFNEFKNREVEIIASNGTIIQENTFNNANAIHIDFRKPLAKGVYFAKVVEQSTLKSDILPFVVK